ncbi:MAG: hypothetical protein V3V15_06275 [Sphingorhabdus sp.]
MNENTERQTAKAGGIFIFIGILAGIAAGIYMGEIPMGMISGFGIGVAAAILTWLFDRTRQNNK